MLRATWETMAVAPEYKSRSNRETGKTKFARLRNLPLKKKPMQRSRTCDILGNLGVREGAEAFEGAIMAAVDWLILEYEQVVHETVGSNRREIILQHIKSNFGYCTDDYFNDAGEEPRAKRKVSVEVSPPLDILDGHPMIVRSSQVQIHVRQMEELLLLAGSLEEHNFQSGDTELEMMIWRDETSYDTVSSSYMQCRI